MELQGFEKLIASAWITVLVLFTPIMFILFDLWAGVRKAKLRGEKVTSAGLRRTFAKIAKYYNVLLALLVIDVIQIACFWFLDTYYESAFPMFPFITLLGSIGVGVIEVKSIFEKADEKMKRQMSDVALLAVEIAKHKSEPEELAKSIAEYMKGEKNVQY